MNLTKHQREMLGMFTREGFKYTLEQRKKHIFVFVDGELVTSLHQGGKASRRHALAVRSVVNRLKRGRANSYARAQSSLLL